MFFVAIIGVVRLKTKDDEPKIKFIIIKMLDFPTGKNKRFNHEFVGNSINMKQTW